jgi:hypothetical protein
MFSGNHARAIHSACRSYSRITAHLVFQGEPMKDAQGNRFLRYVASAGK